MAKKNQMGKDKKENVDSQKKRKKRTKKAEKVQKVPLVYHEVNGHVNANANVHPNHWGHDE